MIKNLNEYYNLPIADVSELRMAEYQFVDELVKVIEICTVLKSDFLKNNI